MVNNQYEIAKFLKNYLKPENIVIVWVLDLFQIGLNNSQINEKIMIKDLDNFSKNIKGKLKFEYSLKITLG